MEKKSRKIKEPVKV